MRYIKRYESEFSTVPKVGDYVIVSPEFSHEDSNLFLSKQVGKIARKKDKWYFIEFRFTAKESGAEVYDFLRTYFWKNYFIIPFRMDEIISFSKNKKDLETMKNIRKFNL